MTDKCNDCGNPDKGVMLVRGVSDLAGGEYYNGPEICEKCIDKRREQAVTEYEYITVTTTTER